MSGRERGGLLLEREGDIRGKGEIQGCQVGKEVASSWRGRETLGVRGKYRVVR